MLFLRKSVDFVLQYAANGPNKASGTDAFPNKNLKTQDSITPRCTRWVWPTSLTQVADLGKSVPRAKEMYFFRKCVDFFVQKAATMHD